MPVIVNCPSCNGPLRVADELLRRKVRCPSCQNIFEATEPPPSGNGSRQEEEPERIDSWKQLDLELARDRDPAPAPPPPPRPSPPPRQEIPPLPPTRTVPPPSRPEVPPPPRQEVPRMPGLVGAVEIDPGPQEPPRRPTTPPPDERPEPKRDAPANDDLRPCPGCRRMIHRDSTRCYNCGERLGDSSRSRHHDDDRRDSGRDVRRSRHDDFDRQPRRDTEPHRGTIVLVLGIISLVCLTGFCFLIPNIVGVVLGVIGWWMGQVDLGKIKAGSMDPEGHGMTQGGWVCSILGTVLNLLVTLACGAYFVVFALADMERQQQMQKPGFQQPPPQRKMLDEKPALR